MKKDTFLFSISRIGNAGAVLVASSVAALMVGAEEWANIAIIQSSISYCIFFSLGLGEGLGQIVVSKPRICTIIFYKLSALYIFFLITVLVVGGIFFIFDDFRAIDFRSIDFRSIDFRSIDFRSIDLIDFNLKYFLVPLGTVSLLLFSLSRIYYRGIGGLNELKKLFFYNAVLISLSPVLVYYSREASSYLLFFIFSSIASVYFVILSSKECNNLQFIKYILNPFLTYSSISFFFNRIVKTGFPLMLAAVTFELIISLDRFYINYFISTSATGTIALSLVLIKGCIMLLSILNSIFFKKLADLVIKRDFKKVKVIFLKQVMAGLVCYSLFVAIMYWGIKTEWFKLKFPSYNQLHNIFISQSIILIPLSVIFPISVISNFLLGGKVYLFILIIILTCYLCITFFAHFIIGTLSILYLNIIVFSSLTFGLVLFLILVRRKAQ